ncbi:MAG: ATP-binding protein [bacterium]
MIKAFPKPDQIVNRDQQWAELTALWEHAKPRLVFGLGRRRAGKSWVLARFAKAVGGIYYQATNRTEAEQLAALSRIVGQHFQEAALRGVPFPDWESLFQYLADKANGNRSLLVLDEFPYLANAAPALTSIIQALWDHEWQDTRLKLVLNGSHITAMRHLEAADQPLFGRRTERLSFPPLTHEYVRAFVPDYAPREQLVTHSIFGGLPGHLALLETAADLATNVQRQILSPSGRLLDEAQHMLDAFLQDADIHYSIIQAIANGAHTWSKIANRLGKSAGSLSRPMNWLEEMQVVARTVPITEANPQKSKRSLYRITDPYVAFWHRFVAPILATGESTLLEPEQLWQTHVVPGLDNYMGRPFEEICRGWTGRSEKIPFRPTRVGSWWDADSRNEIDVVAIGPGGELLIGECKWGQVDDTDLETLRDREALIRRDFGASTRVRQVYHAVYSGTGKWSPGVASEIAAGRLLGFSPEDLMAT